MKRRGLLLAGTMVVFLVIGVVLSGCKEKETGLKVVTTTALLAQIVERVAGDMVDVVNIIPPSQCPGHFDVKPGDIQKLSDAELFLMHGWQGELFAEELVASANNPDLTTIVINASVGENINWMVPAVQQVAVDNIVAALSQVDSEDRAVFEDLATKYKSEIETKAAEIDERITEKDFASVNVMCNEQLTGLVRWMGLNIIATYGRPDSLTPQVVKNLVDTAREEGVVLFIDNLQSGAEAAVQMAEELDCNRVTLTNFPGGFDGTETWEKAIDYDIDRILSAISQ